MKKTLTMLLILCMVFTLFACSPQAPAATPESPADSTATAAPAEVAAPAEAASSDDAAVAAPDFSDVTVVGSRWAGPNADTQKAIVKNYTNGTIIIDDVDYNNLKEKQILSMSASAEYDLIWVPEVWLPEYVANGWLLPLDELVARDSFPLDNYLSGIVDIGKVDGKLYAMPDMMQGLMMTYNMEWLEKEGQNIPTTWDELLALSKYFKDAGTGIGLPVMQGQAAMDLFAMILYSNGGDYFDANGKLALTDDVCLEAAKQYAELCKYAMSGSATWHNDQVSEAIRTGKCPFGITLSGLAGLDANPEGSVISESVAYGAMPGAKKVAGCLNTWSWAIAANSANPDAAWEAVKYLVSEPVEKQMAVEIGHTSAVKSLSEDADVLAAEPFLPALSAQMAEGKTQPLNANAAALSDPLQAALSEIAASGADPVAVFTKLQNDFVDTISIG